MLKWVRNFVKYRLNFVNCKLFPELEWEFMVCSKRFLGPSFLVLTKFHLILFHKLTKYVASHEYSSYLASATLKRHLAQRHSGQIYCSLCLPVSTHYLLSCFVQSILVSLCDTQHSVVLLYVALKKDIFHGAGFNCEKCRYAYFSVVLSGAVPGVVATNVVAPLRRCWRRSGVVRQASKMIDNDVDYFPIATD